MNAAAALDQQHSPAALATILNHAIAEGKLLPNACDIQGFSHHHNKDQMQYSVQTAAGAFFIKCQQSEYADHFQAEETSLETLMATQTIATCAPLAVGECDDFSYIILQHLPLAVHGDWFSAGQQLAQMHQHHSDQGYGFPRTTYCGETAQDNRWNHNWSDFFIKQRLQPLVDQLAAKGTRFNISRLCLIRCGAILAEHQPEASLLHGDLWSGNIGFNPDRNLSYPMIFDPASYYGDAESDLAMTELFGRFPKKFYDGYQSVSTLSEGYQQRSRVYQLYHLLNHALLFGHNYIQQSEALMMEILQHDGTDD